ncbi:MAG: ABC transporter permease, partial [Pseudomonadota bacterium]
MSFKLHYLLRGFARTLNQSRTLMAVLALAVAIATLMQVYALRAGATGQLQALLADTGANVVTVAAETRTALPGRSNYSAMADSLRAGDVQAMEAVAGSRLVRVAPVASGSRKVEFREAVAAVTVTGTQPAYFALRRFAVAQGRLLQALDEEQSDTVAVLGAQVATALFGEEQEQVLAESERVGSTIAIGGIPFTVIGILQARGTGQAGSQDDGIYIPLSTAQRRLLNVDYYNSVMLEMES